MRAPGRGYSRAVTVAKIVLPAIAIGILATLFLLARTTPQGEPLRFVDEDVRDLAESQRLGRPRHAAVTEEGAQLTILADTLFPDAARPRVTHGRNLSAQLIAPGEDVYDITARTGTIDDVARLSTLRGDVVIETSEGYRLRTEALQMRTDRTYMQSLAPVRAAGPPGTLRANRMEIFADESAGGVTRMVFTGDVRLVYTP